MQIVVLMTIHRTWNVVGRCFSGLGQHSPVLLFLGHLMPSLVCPLPCGGITLAMSSCPGVDMPFAVAASTQGQDRTTNPPFTTRFILFYSSVKLFLIRDELKGSVLGLVPPVCSDTKISTLFLMPSCPLSTKSDWYP